MNGLIPLQTSQVLLGAGVGLLYTGAVLSIGLLSLLLFLQPQLCAKISTHIGLVGCVWFGFIIGQGVLGLLWLVVSLAGLLKPVLIWGVLFSAVGIGLIVLLPRRTGIAKYLTATCCVSRLLISQSWYFWVCMGIALVILLRGIIATLPPENDDALMFFLPVATSIAAAHRLAAQTFTLPHSALYPLQVEMHWAALFAVSNESAVTLWDYLCGVSFVFGAALLGCLLTGSRRVAVLIVLMMLSTPAVFDLLGGGAKWTTRLANTVWPRL